MFSVLERLAPLAISLMNNRGYAHGGGVHPRHYMDGGYGEEYPGQQYPEQEQYQQPEPPQLQQVHQPQPYMQNDPSMNAPMGEPVQAGMQYAHGGHHPHYMHGGYNHGGYHHGGMESAHYAHGGHPHHYFEGGHMPHYAFGGAFKGMMNVAKPMMHEAVNKGVQHFGNKAAGAAGKFATKHFGEEAGHMASNLAHKGAQHAGQKMHHHLKAVGGPLYPYQR